LGQHDMRRPPGRTRALTALAKTAREKAGRNRMILLRRFANRESARESSRMFLHETTGELMADTRADRRGKFQHGLESQAVKRFLTQTTMPVSFPWAHRRVAGRTFVKNAVTALNPPGRDFCWGRESASEMGSGPIGAIGHEPRYDIRRDPVAQFWRLQYARHGWRFSVELGALVQRLALNKAC